MQTQLRARFDGRVFVPIDAVDLPVGEIFTFRPERSPVPHSSEVAASLPAEGAVTEKTNQVAAGEKTGLQLLAELAEQFEADPDWPADGATQHDHYLYGTPKRDDA